MTDPSNTDASDVEQVAEKIEASQYDIRMLSAEDLGRLGVAQIAYVKPVVVNGAVAFAIHAADGTPMAVAETPDVAFAAILQHELLPALVH
jgi:hypothetical protein